MLHDFPDRFFENLGSSALYAKWKAELDRKRTDLTATRATSRNAQVHAGPLLFS